MKKNLIVLSSLGLVFAPLFAFAATCVGVTGIEAFICKIGSILNTLIPIMVVLGVVYFIWGVLQYVMSGEEEAKKKGKSHMIYGIIGLVVIVGLWGLINIVTSTFSIQNQTITNLPCVPGTPGCP